MEVPRKKGWMSIANEGTHLALPVDVDAERGVDGTEGQIARRN
jgi:hypothetical protein